MLKKFLFLFFICSLQLMAQNDLVPVTPPELRGRIDMERQGLHDANKIRTLFYNYGMVGDYPPDPLKVDYSVFHSVEVPKGSGENYSDGITPFVLAKVMQRNGKYAYIMETGYRERQGTSPLTGKTMRFEPRPGYFQTDPTINVARSVAMSNDPRTWPDKWVDKMNDPLTQAGVAAGMVISVKHQKQIKKVSLSMMINFMMPGIFILIQEIIHEEVLD